MPRTPLHLLPLVAVGLGALGAGTLLNGCTVRSSRPQPRTGVHVVTALAPLRWLVMRIGGSEVDVSNLAAPGVEPHDLELRASQIDDILDADLVVYIAGFQPALDAALRHRRGPSLDLLRAVAGPEGAPRSADPHLWLDPDAFRVAADAVAGNLVARRPSLDVRSRLAGVAGELASLDRDFASGLRSCDRREIVSAHNAFGRLAARYRLTNTAITRAPEGEPNADRLLRLARSASARGTTTVFTEELASPRVAQTLAREAHLNTAVLATLESMPDDGATHGDPYLTAMRTNLVRLRAALGCR